MKKVKRVVRRLWTRIRIARVRLFRWWHGYDKKYGWKWRVGSLATAALMLLTIVLPVAQVAFDRDRYRLDDTTLSMVGHTDPSLARQLTYDAKAEKYVFNKDAIAMGDAAGLPAKLQKATTGAADKSNAKTYSLEIPEDFSKGVTYHDTNSQLSFSLVPQFDALNAKTEQGHIVFPVHGGSQAVYTLKNNGLKEDIIVPEVRESTLTYTYQLKLPKTLEARALPDGSGAIGIYSANPALFGDISYGSDSDRARVEKAREANAKDTLVFGLPAPVTLNADGKEVGSTRFELKGDRLSVIAESLTGVKGPIAIDPSVTVTSSSDFQTNGNNEGMIDFGTSGQITRGGLTGGTLASWSAATSLSYQFEHARSVVYNGNLYLVGGLKRTPTTNYSTVSYVAINSDGTLGTWNTTTSMPYAWNDGGLVAYNGYIYTVAGLNDSSGGLANSTTTYYAPINSNGTIGTWNTTSALPVSLRSNTAVAYGGYLYSLSGTTGSNDINATANVYYAPINANGTVGTWNTTTSLTFARNHSEAVAYNGYMYILGGATTAPAYTNVVQYAKINSDGTLGSWNSTNNFTTSRYGMFAGVYNGYIYITGGTNGTGRTDTQYAQINANGTLGTWAASPNNLANSKIYPAGAIYNGYVYVAGGYDNSVNYSDVQYAAIDPAGKPASFTTLSNAYTTARKGVSVVAYNGYLYVMNGDAGSTPSSGGFRMAINTDGTLGTVNTVTATGNSNRTFTAAFAYQNYMYMVGGCSSALSSCTTGSNNVATVISAPINSSTGAISSWSSQTSLPAAVYGHAAIAYNGYAYVFGGLNGSTFQNTVYSAQLGASGAITSWNTLSSTYNMPTAVAGFGFASNGPYVYYGGGCTAGNLSSCSTRSNSVYYAKFDESGGLSTNWTSTASFTNARYGLGMTVNKGYLYLAGGYDSTSNYADTQYAKLASNGSVGTWATGTSFANAAWGGGLTSYSGRLYQAGGYDNSSYYRNVYYTSSNNGGQMGSGTWTTNASDLSSVYNTNWGYGGSFAANGYIYLLGGVENSSTTTRDEVYSAPLGVDGSVGSFTLVNHLPSGRLQFAIAVNNNYVYVIGGQTGTYTATVAYAPIQTGGGLGSWTTGASFSTARALQAAAIYNGYIYMSGGSNGTVLSDVQVAPLNANGSIGSWTSTSSMNVVRFRHAMVATNGYMYVMGGRYGSTNATNYETVEYAQINSDGTLGTWNYTSSMVYPIVGMKAFVSNGMIVTIAGSGSGTYTNQYTLNYVPINADGTLGAWQMGVGSNSSLKADTAAVLYNGYIYSIAGTSSLGIYYMNLPVIQRTGTYSKLMDLGSEQNISGITYNGLLPYGVANIAFKAASSSGVFSTTGIANDLIATGTCTTSVNGVRYLLVTVTLDDSQGGIFADSNGTMANVTDFTVNYALKHPPPQIRLRHGQTLQQGTLSALDTCYP